MVIVLHRHGARTPLDDIPGVPVNSPEYMQAWGHCPSLPRKIDGTQSFWPIGPDQPCKPGDLTPVGMDMMRDLGQYLRVRYGNHVLFQEDSMTVRSTGSPRAILSAASLVQGFCPGMPQDEALSFVKTPHEPFSSSMVGTAPVWSTLTADSEMNNQYCERMCEILKEAREQWQRNEASKHAWSTFNAIVERSSLEETKSLLYDLADVSACYAANGTPLPQSI